MDHYYLNYLQFFYLILLPVIFQTVYQLTHKVPIILIEYIYAFEYSLFAVFMYMYEFQDIYAKYYAFADAEDLADIDKDNALYMRSLSVFVKQFFYFCFILIVGLKDDEVKCLKMVFRFPTFQGRKGKIKEFTVIGADNKERAYKTDIENDDTFI
jgi:hypothetical protein